jgi:hypothetical protein
LVKSGFIFKNCGYWTAVARHWGTIENLRPGPGPNSAPVQSRLLGATGPATDRTRLHHTSARRAATEGDGRPAYADMNKYVAAAVGMAIAVLFIAPVVLTGASSAHADTGVNGYLRCIKSDAEPPPPGVHARDWFPIVRTIETGLNSAESPAEVADKLVGMGVKPNDAVTQVQCVLANEP